MNIVQNFETPTALRASDLDTGPRVEEENLTGYTVEAFHILFGLSLLETHTILLSCPSKSKNYIYPPLFIPRSPLKDRKGLLHYVDVVWLLDKKLININYLIINKTKKIKSTLEVSVNS